MFVQNSVFMVLNAFTLCSIGLLRSRYGTATGTLSCDQKWQNILKVDVIMNRLGLSNDIDIERKLFNLHDHCTVHRFQDCTCERLPT